MNRVPLEETAGFFHQPNLEAKLVFPLERQTLCQPASRASPSAMLPIYSQRGIYSSVLGKE